MSVYPIQLMMRPWRLLMMMKWILSLFVVLSLVTGFLLFRDTELSPKVIARSEPALEAQSEPEPLELDLATPDEEASVVRGTVGESIASVVEPASESKQESAEPQRLIFEARVVEVLEDGTERDAQKGVIQLSFLSGNF